MTDTDLMRRLVAMQHTLRGVVDLCNASGVLCDQAGAKGLAMATHLLGEAVAVFANELNGYVLGGDDESVDSL